MITPGIKVLFNSRKNRLPVMVHARRFAMKEPRRAHHPATEHLANRLMTQTNAENRYRRTKMLDNLHGYSRIVGRARAGRNYNSIGLQIRRDLIDCSFIIAAHHYLLAEFTQILNQVVREGIVVVDYQEHIYCLLLFSASRRIMIVLPRPFFAAQAAAVSPSLSLMRGSAPLSSSSLTALSLPYAAAHIKAVPPSLFFTLGLAPASSNIPRSGMFSNQAAPCTAASPS